MTFECRDNVIVGCRIGQVHPFDMYDFAEWHQLDKFTGQGKTAPFSVGPFVMNRPSWARVAFADRHGPAVWAQHPFLDQSWLDVCAVDRLRRCSKTPSNDDESIAF